MRTREQKLESALRKIWAEARKNKPNPDRIFALADAALSEEPHPSGGNET